MLVDPRPYTYEYRAPRYSNPTYLSNNLYDSLYMRSSSPNDYFSSNQKMTHKDSGNPEQVSGLAKHRNQSMDLNSIRKQALISERQPQQDSGFKLPSINKNPEKSVNELPAVNSLNVAAKGGMKRGFERFRVYENQQKPFDIIKNIPKAYESNRLRNWPKFSLEHKLREKGLFHNYEKEDL